MRRSCRAGLVSSLVSTLAVLFALAAPHTAGAQQDERTPVPANAQPAPQNPKPAAQIPPSTSRPKIGVALEGAGALGLAHIGVLQWFEDHHIPIDYLAGTSMGSLVGGMYATGKSPQDLQNLVNAQNWDIIIGGQTNYSDLSFRRKEDQRAIQNTIKLGLKHGLS